MISLNLHGKLDKDNWTKLKPSIEEPPKLELKKLPSHPEYAFLAENSKLSVIIASNLEAIQKDKLLEILTRHNKAVAWKKLIFGKLVHHSALTKFSRKMISCQRFNLSEC